VASASLAFPIYLFSMLSFHLYQASLSSPLPCQNPLFGVLFPVFEVRYGPSDEAFENPKEVDRHEGQVYFMAQPRYQFLSAALSVLTFVALIFLYFESRLPLPSNLLSIVYSNGLIGRDLFRSGFATLRQDRIPVVQLAISAPTAKVHSLLSPSKLKILTCSKLFATQIWPSSFPIRRILKDRLSPFPHIIHLFCPVAWIRAGESSMERSWYSDL
jgi:hypothetical protein